MDPPEESASATKRQRFLRLSVRQAVADMFVSGLFRVLSAICMVYTQLLALAEVIFVV